jgi:hypothetical protein
VDRPRPLSKLKFLHADVAMSAPKIERFRRVSTCELKASLAPGQPGSLKTRPDGTILDGHHRVTVLAERGEDVDQLPREIIEKEFDEA